MIDTVNGYVEGFPSLAVNSLHLTSYNLQTSPHRTANIVVI